VLYGFLTALSGLAVLVLNNPGYGVPLDYIFALLGMWIAEGQFSRLRHRQSPVR
jgi:hypothetical protein